MNSNRLVRMACSVARLKLDSLEVVVERRMRDTIKTIPGQWVNPFHLLNDGLWQMKSTQRQRLVPPQVQEGAL